MNFSIAIIKTLLEVELTSSLFDYSTTVGKKEFLKKFVFILI